MRRVGRRSSWRPTAPTRDQTSPVGVDKEDREAADVPAFGRVAYLAASETEVALIKAKSGALKMKVTGEALARAPRAEIDTVHLNEGKLLSHLRLQFANGTVWEFDVPKIGKKNAKQLVFALGGDLV